MIRRNFWDLLALIIMIPVYTGIVYRLLPLEGTLLSYLDCLLIALSFIFTWLYILNGMAHKEKKYVVAKLKDEINLKYKGKL